MGQVTSELQVSMPSYKLQLGGPSYKGVGQVTSEWAKLQVSGPIYK